MIADALKLSVYFGDSVEADGGLASDVLMQCFLRHGVTAAALLRGIEGFGANRRLHAQRFPDVSTDLPLVAVAVDTHDLIRGLLADVDAAVPRGLVTLEHARIATDDDVADAEFPAGYGNAVTLTVFCGAGERTGGRPAYREVVDILRGHGVSGAIVLPGVDGVLAGRRHRSRLFAFSDNAPMVVVSVGDANIIQRALRPLSEQLTRPVVTLERMALVKHDGELLDLPPTVRRTAAPAGAASAADLWQTIGVYTRRNAEVNGAALYSELTRRLRELGGAGATTVLGDWGYSSDEPPHGDKLARVASHRPTYTVYIDRPEKVAELWPVIDEVTAEHGVVTALVVPGFRERVGEVLHGSLDAVEHAAHEWELAPLSPVEAEARRRSAWLQELENRVREFTRQRGGRPPVVRVTLADGERFFLLDIDDGPADDWLTLYPHPERYHDMLPGKGSSRVSPRAVIVPRASIVKLELMPHAPRGTRAAVTLRL